MKRKQLRIPEYDYSTNGFYFITICTQDRKEILSKISKVCEPVGTGVISARQIRTFANY